jgi:acyl-CoA synthetase (AMP-forming)/AMP-acid ligase II
MTDGAYISFGERFLAHAENRPDQPAVVCDGVAIAYGALNSKAGACARRLQALGLEAGGTRRVGLLAANSLDFIVVFLACQLAGIAVVPLPGLITPDAQARMIDDASIAVLFHDHAHAEAARTAVALAGNSAERTLVTIGLSKDAPAGLLSVWLSETTSPFEPHPPNESWASDLIYSSGTTGIPKGIVQSYGGRASTCVSLAGLGVTDGVRLLHTVGLYSNFGLSAAFLALWWGGTLFMMSKFSGPATVEMFANDSIDMAWFAPATLIRTMEAPGFRAAAAERSCIKLCAGAPLTEAYKREILARWQGPLFDLYGQTETGTLTLLPLHHAPANKFGSVGKMLPTVQVRIIDDAGRVVAVGEEGEIVGHSTTLMTGYHQRQDANTAAFWSDEEGRSYIRTGDIGKVDTDGYLWLCDRKKDMIISGGYNIYPADIERTFSDHPAVFEVAVVGLPSNRWGESPVAFLTLRENATADEDELRTWANARLGSIQKVAAVKVLSELPNGTMGKILKRELRDRFGGEIGMLP